MSSDLGEETRKERIASWCANMQIKDAAMIYVGQTLTVPAK